MRWIFLGLGVGAFACLWGAGHGYVQFAAFLIMFANFATFCVLYDRPKYLARARVEAHLRQLNPNSDVAQRMASAQVVPTAADRHLGFGPMTIANLATGVSGAALLLWGLWVRLF